MNFDEYLESMKSNGYTYNDITLDEFTTRIININDLKNNEIGIVAKIKPEPRTIIAISGIKGNSKPDCLAIELCDENNTEISPTTKLIIRKVTHFLECDDVVQIDRPVYELCSLRNKLDEHLGSYHKFYKFKHGIELKGKYIEKEGEDFLEIVVIKPDKDISSKHIKLTLKCYLLTK